MPPADPQKVKEAQEYIDSQPEERKQQLILTNDGSVIVNNRARRRNFGPDNPQFTKANKKKRTKKAKTYGKTKH